MQKRWSEAPEPPAGVVSLLCRELNIEPVLARLLALREVETFDSAKAFFRPDLRMLHDPFLMKDMEPALLRIEQAMANQEKILVYGDYDVDGTTAVALVYQFFHRFYQNIDFYIPDRYREGYGISTAGIDFAAENGFSLIIALDCGIKSIDKVEYANSKGIDFIICDHHLPGIALPPAVAVLDPKRADCPYPYKELSGCGIGFKLAQAFSIKHDLPEEQLYCYLDLLAVSIAADIVPITGENRILAWFGMQKINSDPCPGLNALMNVAGRKSQYTISDVVFTIGPRINAAGRMADARHAVSLMIAQDDESCRRLSSTIDFQNAERKGHDSSITEQALQLISGSPDLLKRKSTVVFNESWHKGVIGIVASRLTETYYRPTIVLTASNGLLSGSARSVPGFDLYEALSACSDLLEQFGGHKYAAGLTLKPENMEAFSRRFEEVVDSLITEEMLVQEIRIDSRLSLTDIQPKFFRILQQFEPFGPQNLAPVFLSEAVSLVGLAGIVGDNHLKLCISQNGSPIFECIGFGLGDYREALNKGGAFDVCYTIEENNFRDRRNLQLNIRGIRLRNQPST